MHDVAEGTTYAVTQPLTALVAICRDQPSLAAAATQLLDGAPSGTGVVNEMSHQKGSGTHS